MDKFSRLDVQIRNLNPKVALHSMCSPYDLASLLLVCARNLLTTWMSYANELKVTFRWKKCRGSKMKSDRLYKRGRKEKVA